MKRFIFDYRKLRRPLVLWVMAFASGISAACLRYRMIGPKWWQDVSAITSGGVFRKSGGFAELAAPGGSRAPAAVMCICACCGAALCIAVYRSLDDCDMKSRMRTGTVWFVMFFLAGNFAGSVDLCRESALCSGFQKSGGFITGRVQRCVTEGDGSVKLEVRERETGEKILVTVRDYCSEKDHGEAGLQAADFCGRNIKIAGWPEPPGYAKYSGAFDYNLYLRSRGILSVMNTERSAVKILNGKMSLYEYAMNRLSVTRERFQMKISDTMQPEAAGLFCGIMFGDESRLDQETGDIFRHVGTGHLLAVSGLHTGMVYAVLRTVLMKPVSLAGNLPVMLLLAVYAAAAGFSPSIARAVFMIGVRIFAMVTHRRYDFLTCIAFCGGVMLMLRPCRLFSSGFQLSFMAVISLSVILPGVEKALSGIWGKIYGNKYDSQQAGTEKGGKSAAENIAGSVRRAIRTWITGTLSLQLGMLPLTVYSFHYSSAAGFAANPPSIALAGIIVPLGLAVMPVYAVTGGTGIIWRYVLLMPEMLLRVLIEINRAAFRMFGYMYLPTPPLMLIVLYYLVIFFVFSECGSDFLKKYGTGRQTVLLVLAAAAISAGIGAGPAMDWNAGEMIFINAGKGDICHIKTGGCNALIMNISEQSGTDGEKTGRDLLIPYFLGHGIMKIDCIATCMPGEQFYQAVSVLSEAAEIENIVVPYGAEGAGKADCSAAELHGIEVIAEEEYVSVIKGSRKTGFGRFIDGERMANRFRFSGCRVFRKRYSDEIIVDTG